MDTLIVQTGSRHGRVAELSRSSNGLLSVGRGYDNDLVLTDIHIAPHQLHFQNVAGDWFVTVLDETNPVLLNGIAVTNTRSVVKAGDTVTVGRTRLMLHAPDEAVEPTRKMALSNWLATDSIGAWIPLLALVGINLVDLLINHYFLSTTLDWTEMGYTFLFGVLLCLLWAAIWGVTGRIIRHQHHFGLQLIVSCLGSLLMTLLGLAGSYLAFYTFNATATEVMAWLATALALVLLFRFNFVIATNVRKTALAASIATILLLGTIYGLSYYWSSGELQYEPEYANTLVPPPFVLGSGSSVDEYFDAVDRRFAKLPEAFDSQ